MTSPEKKKAPIAVGAIKYRDTNTYQEEGITMKSTLPQTSDNRESFDTRLTVQLGGFSFAEIQPIQLVDGTAAVSIDLGGEDGTKSFSPSAACALAAALQAAAVHAMESTEAVAA